jgi:hypothetical protein
MGNKKAKQAREDAPAMERLQSSIENCIASVAMNYAVREGKEAAREVCLAVWHGWAGVGVQREVVCGYRPSA